MDKRSPSNGNFSDFQLIAWKLTKFLMSFFKSWASFALNFASPFSVMGRNSYEIFQLKHYMFWTKTSHQSTISQIFECSNESSPNSSCHFWNHNVKVYSNFASLLSVMKDNSSVFLQLKPCTFWAKRAHWKNFQTFGWLGENSRNPSCHAWNNKSIFL